MKIWLGLLCVVFSLVACDAGDSGNGVSKPHEHHPTGIKAVDDPKITWVESVETAHAKTIFLKHDSIAFDIELFFGGSKRLDARMTLATNSSAGRIAFRDSTFIAFSGSEVTHNTKMSDESARFAAYTWSYFFLYPYKMSDPGTVWASFENGILGSESYEAQKLTFAPGTGDAPDDWYISYVDPSTKLTQVAAYIVTAGGTVEEAEEDPHAIRYHDYKDVQGVPIAQNWSFWAWRTNEGLTDKLGHASLSNISIF